MCLVTVFSEFTFPWRHEGPGFSGLASPHRGRPEASSAPPARPSTHKPLAETSEPCPYLGVPALPLSRADFLAPQFCNSGIFRQDCFEHMDHICPKKPP